MFNQSSMIHGIFTSCISIIAYFVICGRNHKPLKFNEVAELMLSCVGASVAFEFGFKILTKSIDLALCHVQEDQIVTIILGSIAVIWISIEQIITVLKR